MADRYTPPEKASDVVPPQDLNAEQALLGSCLIEPDAVSRALAIVQAQDFYREAHQQIYTAICVVSGRGEPVDMVTVTKQLRRKNELVGVGGAAYLTALMDTVPTAAHVVRYAGIVLDDSRKRKLLKALHATTAECHLQDRTADDLLDHLSEQMGKLREDTADIATRPIAELLPEASENFARQMEQFRKQGSQPYGVLFGHAALDVALTGLRPPKVCMVEAQTKKGKTALKLQAMLHSAVHPPDEKKIPTLMFPLEMDVLAELLPRILGTLSGVSSLKLQFGSTTQGDLNQVTKSMNHLSRGSVDVCERRNVTRQTIEREMRHWARKRKIKDRPGGGLIVLDYLQLIRPQSGRSDDRYSEWWATTEWANEIAAELNLVILMGSQLTITKQGLEYAFGGREQEHHCPLVIKIVADKEEFVAGQDPTGHIVIHLNRFGPSGVRLPYRYVASLTRFVDPQDPREQEAIEHDARFD